MAGKSHGWFRRGRSAARVMFVVAVPGVLVVAGWTMLLPGIAVSLLQSRTGFGVQVEKFSANPFTGRVEIEGLVLTNPAAWPTPEFLDLRHGRLSAELLPLLEGRLVVDSLDVEIRQLTLVRNRAGQLNAEVFRQAWRGENPDGPRSGPVAYLIRRLTVKFDRLVLADHSGREPAVQAYDLQVERELRDVDGPGKIVKPFLGVALNAVLGLYDAEPGSSGNGAKASSQAGRKAGEPLKNFFQSLEMEK